METKTFGQIDRKGSVPGPLELQFSLTAGDHILQQGGADCLNFALYVFSQQEDTGVDDRATHGF